MATPKELFIELFGQRPEALIIRLLEIAKLPEGFEAQEIGLKEASVASSGTIAYAALFTSSVPNTVLSSIVKEIEGWIRANGCIVAHRFEDSDIESSWADSLCLLALCQRPHLISSEQKVALLANRVLALQTPGGAWRFRQVHGSTIHPIFCVYPLLSLLAAYRASLLSDNKLRESLTKLIDYLRGYVDKATESTSFLLAVFCLFCVANDFPDLIPQEMLDDARSRTEERCLTNGRLSLESITVTDPSQPLWYVTINIPLMYLCARHIWPAMHPIPVMLAQLLIDSYDTKETGWKNNPRATHVFSWTTALGILAGYFFSKDLYTSQITLKQWKARSRKLHVKRRRYEFDVVLSFSGQQRDVAERINTVLRNHGLTVFYDRDYQHEILGEELTIYLQRTYFRRSRYAVAILSKDFVRSKWGGNWEWRAILARMQRQKKTYLLPYYWADAKVPGLNPSIGYVSRRTHSPEEFANLIARKILLATG